MKSKKTHYIPTKCFLVAIFAHHSFVYLTFNTSIMYYDLMLYFCFLMQLLHYHFKKQKKKSRLCSYFLALKKNST